MKPFRNSPRPPAWIGLGIAFFAVSAGNGQESISIDDQRLAEAVTEDYGEKAGKIVAELANQDPMLGIEALRRLRALRSEFVKEKGDLLEESVSRHSSYLDEILREAYPGIESLDARMVIFRELVNDESLAKDVDFGYWHLMLRRHSTGDSILKSSSDEKETDAVREARHLAELVDYCKRTPADLPPVMLLPDMIREFDPVVSVDRLIRAPAGGVADPKLPASRQLTDQIRKAVPERFHEVIQIGLELKSEEAGEETFNRLVEMMDRADLPPNARLGVAVELMLSGLVDEDWNTPQPVRLQLANWLAEAWEDHALATSDEDVLRLFIYGTRDEAWTRTARKLVAAWNRRTDRIQEACPTADSLYHVGPIWFLVCLAAETEDSESLARLTDMNQRLGAPLTAFVLMVRSGEHEAAWELVTKQRARVFFGDGHARVPFEPVLESQVEAFIGRISNPELRYLIELHLKIPEDHGQEAMKSNREERIVAMARRFGDAKFATMGAKYSALRLIAKVPEASAIIADEYVAFANLNQVRQHHANHFQSRFYYGWNFDWSGLAEDMMSALLETGDYEQAAAVLKQIADGTAPINPNDFFRQHEETWELLTEVILQHGMPIDSEPFPPDQYARFLPILQFMADLPGSFYDEDQQFLRGQIFAANLRFHNELDRKDEWWAWRRSLDPDFRADLDLQFLKKLHLVPSAAKGDRSKEAALLQPYRFVIEEFEQTPHDAPLEKRLEAIKPRLKHLETMTPDGKSKAPKTIRVLREYGYFSSDELRRCVRELAKVMGYPDEAWWDFFLSGMSEDELEAAGMKQLSLSRDQ